MRMSHLNYPCTPTDHPGSLSKQPLFCGSEQGREQGSNGTNLLGGCPYRRRPQDLSPGVLKKSLALATRLMLVSGLKPGSGTQALRAQLRGEESSMPMKKIIGAIVAGFVLLFAGRYLLHSVLLKSAYMQSSDVWRTPEAMMHRMWAAQLANLIFAVAAVLIYVRGIEQKPWLGQGIRFGILLALATAVPQSLIEYFVYPIHHELALHWIIGEGGLAVLLGVVIAAICQPNPAGA